MKKFALTSLTIARRAIGYGLLATLISLGSIAVYVLNQRDDLGLWHQVDLDSEFDRNSDVTDFTAYLELEDSLFDQLEREVYAKSPPGDSKSVNRYRKGSLVDPTSMPTDWNRSFEMERDEPTAGVLLLHGLSDSPYSLRTLGSALYEAGASVVGLRLPGHGTAPSGLIEVSWKDWAAAVRIAAKHLRERIGDKPLYLVGYSNGGALSVVYALESLDDPLLPRPDGLMLLSPEIGISKAAALAVWQGRVGHWLGLDKLAWNSISAEYDPFKYTSFAVNAGDQAYRITSEIDRRLDRMAKAGKLGDFPKVLAFQSAADATVSAPALVTRLFNRLPENGHELVVFDVNRNEVIEHLLARDPGDELERLLSGTPRPFDLRVVTNRRDGDTVSPEVTIRHRKAGGNGVTDTPAGMAWPKDIFSLSHVALPFPESDPVYGSGENGRQMTLGNRALRGERGTLVIGPGDMLRQKWNPFYPWVEERCLGFVFGKTSAPPVEEAPHPSP